MKISKENIISYIYILIGTLICALSLNIFLSPAKISTGGASGIGIVIYHLLNIPVSLTVLILNIPLFILALKNLGLKFCINGILGTIMLVIMIEFTSGITNISWLNFSSDLMLSSIFGGIFTGVGLSLVFKGGASTGGSDLLAQIIYKKRNIASIGQILLWIDVVIVGITIIAFKNAIYGLYSVIAIYLANQTINIIFEGINSSKVINIITKKGEEISKEIIEKLDRGVTSSKCIGEYTQSEYTHIITIVENSQVQVVKGIVKVIDPKAFMYISPSQEVLGIGFKRLI